MKSLVRAHKQAEHMDVPRVALLPLLVQQDLTIDSPNAKTRLKESVKTKTRNKKTSLMSDRQVQKQHMNVSRLVLSSFYGKKDQCSTTLRVYLAIFGNTKLKPNPIDAGFVVSFSVLEQRVTTTQTPDAETDTELKEVIDTKTTKKKTSVLSKVVHATVNATAPFLAKFHRLTLSCWSSRQNNKRNMKVPSEV